MPIFQLTNEIDFPPAYLADPDGILAVGGDLSSERLLTAYSEGIFPWYSASSPILWWSPDPRMVLFPDELKIAKSMRPVLNGDKFTMTIDEDFESVISACKSKRAEGRDSTWITGEMKEAYLELHELGYAHSVEVWSNGNLAGGLYGVSLGACFFGESMFTNESNASKFGFIKLVQLLSEKGFELIDCQVYTEHLESLGAREIPRKEFLTLLRKGLESDTLRGNWGKIFE